MSNRGHTPVEVLSLLEFRDFDLVVRCLELVLLHIADFAPECQSWEIEVIALCHHHPDNVYPALGVFDAGNAEFEEIERLDQRADAWVRERAFGWLLDASAKVEAVSWKALREEGRA